MGKARDLTKVKKRKSKPKPIIFVGSSSEAADVVSAIELNLEHHFQVTPWTAGVFTPGERPLADLERQLDKTAFGIFVFAKDDKVTSRKQQYDATRDNVILECGLFMGRLGPKNCFVVVPKNRKRLKIPSDLEGFSPVPYDEQRFARDPQGALSSTRAHFFTVMPRGPARRAASAGTGD
jgi:predicted nucleotide-binding protein